MDTTITNILSANFEMTDKTIPSFEGRSLISKLLQPDPSLRFTAKNIQAHSFFSNVDWKLVEAKKLEPPANFVR